MSGFRDSARHYSPVSSATYSAWISAGVAPNAALKARTQEVLVVSVGGDDVLDAQGLDLRPEQAFQRGQIVQHGLPEEERPPSLRPSEGVLQLDPGALLHGDAGHPRHPQEVEAGIDAGRFVDPGRACHLEFLEEDVLRRHVDEGGGTP